jgi:large subunit ribosomal protein L7/L12
MASLGPFAMGGGGGGGGGGGQVQQAAVVEEVKEEVKVEKTHFDVELSSFDPKSKIKVIKEIRGLLGLGLKEAKEMVETSPQWIKKELPKDEAEELCAKMTELGAVMRMA